MSDADADGPVPGPASGVVVRTATAADAAAVERLAGLSASTRRSLARDLDRDLDRDLARAGAGGGDAPLALVAVGPPGAAASAVSVGSATADSTVVGAALGLLQHDEGHVLDLAVAPAWRRRGVGTDLLRALLAALLARGARAVTLEVRAGNLGAQALYRAAGFTVEGRRPGYYPDGEEALLLWWWPDTADPADTATGPITPTTSGTGG